MGRAIGTTAPVNRFELYGALAPLIEQNGAIGLTRQDAPATTDSAAPTAAEASIAEARPAATAARPLRADAVRNRAKVLAAASEAFAAEGLAVPLDEIARRAGVGAGTVYRHFPTKEALFEAVITDRLLALAADAEARLASNEDAGEAFFGEVFGAGRDLVVFVRAEAKGWKRFITLRTSSLQSGARELLTVPAIERELLTRVDGTLRTIDAKVRARLVELDARKEAKAARRKTANGKAPVAARKTKGATSAKGGTAAAPVALRQH